MVPASSGWQLRGMYKHKKACFKVGHFRIILNQVLLVINVGHKTACKIFGKFILLYMSPPTPTQLVEHKPIDKVIMKDSSKVGYSKVDNDKLKPVVPPPGTVLLCTQWMLWNKLNRGSIQWSPWIMLYLLSTTSEFMTVNLRGRGQRPEAKDGLRLP